MELFLEFKQNSIGKRARLTKVDKTRIDHISRHLEQYYPQLKTSSFTDKHHFIIYLFEIALKEKSNDYICTWELQKQAEVFGGKIAPFKKKIEE